MNHQTPNMILPSPPKSQIGISGEPAVRTAAYAVLILSCAIAAMTFLGLTVLLGLIAWNSLNYGITVATTGAPADLQTRILVAATFGVLGMLTLAACAFSIETMQKILARWRKGS